MGNWEASVSEFGPDVEKGDLQRVSALAWPYHFGSYRRRTSRPSLGRTIDWTLSPVDGDCRQDEHGRPRYAG